MKNVWAQAEWSGVPFVSNSTEGQESPVKRAEIESIDISKVGQELVRQAAIPNEGGFFDEVVNTEGFSSVRADLPA